MIEQALYEHLQKQEDILSPYLARHNGRMAIFNQEAPADTDNGWDSESQYGRLVFAMDLKEDPQRQYSATLAVDVCCENGRQAPEELEPIVRELIDGYFFSNEEQTLAAQWSASDYFTEPTDKIIGVTLTFGLLAFPKQTTIEPDPIALFNSWTRSEFEKTLGKTIRIIGYDTMEAAWKPTTDNPAIYWRLDNITSCNWIPDTYNCSWHTALIYGHLLTGDKNENGVIARQLDNILTMKRRLIFEDMSPLMVDRNIRINLGNDQLRVGQIAIDATYGILRPQISNPIRNISVEERRTNNGT